MGETLLLASLVAAAYAATNLDQLLLLVALRARREAALAHGATQAIVIGLALLGESASDRLPPERLSLLGWIPLGLGIAGLLRLWRRRRSHPVEPPTPAPAPAPLVGALTLTMVGQAGDFLAVLVPLVAETGDALLLVAPATVLAMGGLWLLLAQGLASLGPARRLLERVGPYLIPPMLVAIGLYVLLDTPTDAL